MNRCEHPQSVIFSPSARWRWGAAMDFLAGCVGGKSLQSCTCVSHIILSVLNECSWQRDIVMRHYSVTQRWWISVCVSHSSSKPHTALLTWCNSITRLPVHFLNSTAGRHTEANPVNAPDCIWPGSSLWLGSAAGSSWIWYCETVTSFYLVLFPCCSLVIAKKSQGTVIYVNLQRHNLNFIQSNRCMVCLLLHITSRGGAQHQQPAKYW